MAEVYGGGGGSDPALIARVGGLEMAIQDRDTAGNIVPTWKAHSYTYDNSGNLSTDTVTDGSGTWVRTYMWSNGAQTSDSGWVKQ